MVENKMREVAKLLGVEMGVPFKVKGYKEKFVIKDYGMKKVCAKLSSNGTLINILCGREEIEQPILDNVEKRYLEGVLKPFKDRVEFIEKCEQCMSGKEYIIIAISSNIRYSNHEYVILPFFDKGTMYKGMELNEKYTPEELGLFQDEKRK